MSRPPSLGSKRKPPLRATIQDARAPREIENRQFRAPRYAKIETAAAWWMSRPPVFGRTENRHFAAATRTEASSDHSQRPGAARNRKTTISIPTGAPRRNRRFARLNTTAASRRKSRPPFFARKKPPRRGGYQNRRFARPFGTTGRRVQSKTDNCAR